MSQSVALGMSKVESLPQRRGGKRGKERIRKVHPLPEALALKHYSSFLLTFYWLHLSERKLGIMM